MNITERSANRQDKTSILTFLDGTTIHGKRVDVTLALKRGTQLQWNSDSRLDRSLLLKTDSSIKSMQDYFTDQLSFQFRLYTSGARDYDLKHTVYAQKDNDPPIMVGYSTALDSFDIMFKSGAKLSEALGYSSMCFSVETSANSFSSLLHNICQMTLLLSSPVDSSVETHVKSRRPDITLHTKPTSVNIDICANDVDSKIKKYKQSNVPVVALNKYSLVRVMYDTNDRYIKDLIYQSSMNDKIDVGYVSQMQSTQSSGRPSVFSADYLDLLISLNDKQLDFISEYCVQLIEEDYDRMSIGKPDVIKQVDLLRYCNMSNFDFLAIPFIKSNEYVEQPFPKMILKVVGDTLDLNYEEETDRPPRKFYVESDSILIHKQSLEEMMKYNQTESRTDRKIMDYLYYTKTVKQFSCERSGDYYTRTLPSSLTMVDGEIKIKAPAGKRNISKLKPVTPVKVSQFKTMNEALYIGDLYVDPIDAEILESELFGPELLEKLSKNKIYHLLLLFRRVAESVLYSRKSGKAFIVKHPYLTMEAHVYLSGSVTENDKGIAYVSLVENGDLYKTYAWRSHDLKHFKVAQSKLVCSLAGAWPHCHSDQRSLLMALYSALIYENSWGVSKILKPYRYLATGLTYGSPLVGKQYDKVVKVLVENERMVRNKISLTILLSALHNSLKTKPPKGKTPVLKFDEAHLGYEIFLVNLCAKDLYGKRKHRYDMSIEIKDEIFLSHHYITDIRRHFDLFAREARGMLSHIASDVSTAKSNLKTLFRMTRDLSESTKGRFTMSPFTMFYLMPAMKSYFAQAPEKSFMGTCPDINSLMTTKASFSSLKFNNCSALESISELCSFTGCTTTVSLALSILSNSPVDLTFRMTDKDQLGGNREISIMNAQFRVLQSITESLAKKLGKQTGIDMLDNSKKTTLLAEAQNYAIKQSGLCETIDETRWGPNFNTVLFGYMFACLSKYSTECYIPMLTCILSEQKIFQMTLMPELISFQNHAYSLPGLTGQFHMGQGIFHYTSSFYHSLVLKQLINYREKRVTLVSSKAVVLSAKAFVTSDDVSIINCLEPSRFAKEITAEEYNDSLKKSQSELTRITNNYGSMINYHNILTSDYKNMIAVARFEFNSLFFHTDSLGSNSLKFLCSLQDPYTSGNRLRDMRQIADTYLDGLNSNLSETECGILWKYCVKNRLLQWGHNSDEIISILSLIQKQIEDSKHPYEPAIRCTVKSITRDPDATIECPTVLTFKRYGSMSSKLDKMRSLPSIQAASDMLQVKQNTLAMAKQRRLGTNHGIVLSKVMRQNSKIILPIGNSAGAVTCSGTGYLAAILMSRSESPLLSDKSYIIQPSVEENETKPGFGIKVYKQSSIIEPSVLELVVSSYPRINIISPGDSALKIFLHISRSHHTLRLDGLEDLEDLSFLNRYYYFDEIVATHQTTGNAIALRHFKRAETYYTFHFHPVSSVISYYPDVLLPKPLMSLDGKSSAILTVHESYRFNKKKKGVNGIQPGHETNINLSHESFTIEPEDLLTAGRELLRTHKQYQSISSQREKSYLNVKILIKPGQQKQTTLATLGSESQAEIDLDKLSADLLDIFQAEGISTDLFDNLSLDQGTGNWGDEDDDFDPWQAEEDDAEKKEEENPFDLIQSTDTYKVFHKVVSVEVSSFAAEMCANYFPRETTKNAILGRMVKDGYVQNVSKTQSTYLLHSILSGDREPSKTKIITERFANKDYQKDIKLLALFPIATTVEIVSKKVTRDPNRQNSVHKIKQILDVSDDPDLFDTSVFGSMPPDCTITLEPEGRVLSVQDFREVLGNFNDKSETLAERVLSQM